MKIWNTKHNLKPCRIFGDENADRDTGTEMTATFSPSMCPFHAVRKPKQAN